MVLEADSGVVDSAVDSVVEWAAGAEREEVFSKELIFIKRIKH